jgi:phosphomannomutase
MQKTLRHKIRSFFNSDSIVAKLSLWSLLKGNIVIDKIIFEDDWVHLRKSNTEPIIRIYAESSSMNTANSLAKKIIQDIGKFLN